MNRARFFGFETFKSLTAATWVPSSLVASKTEAWPPWPNSLPNLQGPILLSPFATAPLPQAQGHCRVPVNCPEIRTGSDRESYDTPPLTGSLESYSGTSTRRNSNIAPKGTHLAPLGSGVSTSATQPHRSTRDAEGDNRAPVAGPGSVAEFFPQNITPSTRGAAATSSRDNMSAWTLLQLDTKFSGARIAVRNSASNCSPCPPSRPPQ